MTPADTDSTVTHLQKCQSWSSHTWTRLFSFCARPFLLFCALCILLPKRWSTTCIVRLQLLLRISNKHPGVVSQLCCWQWLVNVYFDIAWHWQAATAGFFKERTIFTKEAWGRNRFHTLPAGACPALRSPAAPSSSFADMFALDLLYKQSVKHTPSPFRW